MNIEQIKVAGRYTLTAASSAVSTLVLFHLVTAGDASQITTALNQIGNGLSSIIAGLTTLTAIATALYGMFRSSTTSQVAQVQASPDLQVVPLTAAGKDIVRAAAEPVSVAAVANKMPVIAALMLAAGLLAGCFSSADLNTSASRKTLFGLTNSYGVLLSAAQTYKDLPLCKTGTTTSVTNICSRRSIVVRLQAADRRAVTALQNADAFISRFPTLDATNIIAAAVTAMADYQSVMNETGVQ